MSMHAQIVVHILTTLKKEMGEAIFLAMFWYVTIMHEYTTGMTWSYNSFLTIQWLQNLLSSQIIKPYSAHVIMLVGQPLLIPSSHKWDSRWDQVPNYDLVWNDNTQYNH